MKCAGTILLRKGHVIPVGTVEIADIHRESLNPLPVGTAIR